VSVGSVGDVLTRFIVWRLVGLAAGIVAVGVALWAIHGGLGRALGEHVVHRRAGGLGATAAHAAGTLESLAAAVLVAIVPALMAGSVLVLILRLIARRRRRYVRLRVIPFRTDECGPDGLVALFESLHQALLQPPLRRALVGQPSLALEAHCAGGGDATREAWLAVSVPAGTESAVESALRGAYSNCALEAAAVSLGSPPALSALRKRAHFTKRAKPLDGYEHQRSPAMNRLLTVMGACPGPAYVQLALTPAPAWFERHAAHAYRREERRMGRREAGLGFLPRRSRYDEVELEGGLWLQHRPLFFADLRVVAADRASVRRIGAELRAQGAENRLVERVARWRVPTLGSHDRRLARGEGDPLPHWRKGAFAPTELAALWHLPSIDWATLPFARSAVPTAPAPPAIHRPVHGTGLLRDALGPVSIDEHARRGNLAVPGAVEQGKTSVLVASAAEDLRREGCSIVLLDPKGDAADAVLSVVPRERTCTLLDFSHPTCGFNPLAASAPPDVVADYVVAALRNLFSDADIRASSDRYLRNSVIAVLANDPRASLWDAARLLSVGPDGYAFRARVGANVRGIPEFKEISEFFTAELATQLADSRATTTSKLDAPANKLARLLSSTSIKRVLRNPHLRLDFDRVISGCEVLIVKGALGTMGAGNTAVLMQLLLGMLDAALARQQDRVPAEQRVAVALKIDEAPLVVNRGFADTLALKRSAGLETVACWQADAQWVDRDIRDQLDALFAHRVYFATASVRDARASAALLTTELSEGVRAGSRNPSALGRPDARLHLPKHHAIVSFTTPSGRQQPFLAQTTPLKLDQARMAFHRERQERRGGRYLADLRQWHWDEPASAAVADGEVVSRAATHTRAEGAWDGRRGASPSRATRPTLGGREHERGEAPQSYRELVGIDGANRVRIVRPASARMELELEPVDLEILALVASFRQVLSTQIHRRFNGGRAQTTTQRRLKRLAEARLLGRLQFHRGDGAGTPICYAITDAGIAALRRGRERSQDAPRNESAGPEPPPPPHGEDRRSTAQVRHELHVTGWALALEQALGGGRLRVKGPAESVISPLMGGGEQGERALAPRDLRLPAGRTAHDFKRTIANGTRVEVERFETVRPDATIELPGGIDLLVELDDRLPVGRRAQKLERYDHLISGWAMRIKRYGARLGRPPQAVFVCRDRTRARECARRADSVLVACQAYPGRYPQEWEYPGRAGILFAAERDVHAGALRAYGLQQLPPEVRASHATNGPSARVAEPHLLELPTGVETLVRQDSS
jgi:hypothetical protein